MQNKYTSGLDWRKLPLLAYNIREHFIAYPLNELSSVHIHLTSAPDTANDRSLLHTPLFISGHNLPEYRKIKILLAEIAEAFGRHDFLTKDKLTTFPHFPKEKARRLP